MKITSGFNYSYKFSSLFIPRISYKLFEIAVIFFGHECNRIGDDKMGRTEKDFWVTQTKYNYPATQERNVKAIEQ